jgi:hypothetical protein
MDAIYYYLPFLETIRDFMELGGPVLRVIGIVTVIMWMLIMERLIYFRTKHKALVRQAHNYWDERRLLELEGPSDQDLDRVADIRQRGTQPATDQDVRGPVPLAGPVGHGQRHDLGIRGHGHLGLG